jgi:hypothetical protein
MSTNTSTNTKCGWNLESNNWVQKGRCQNLSDQYCVIKNSNTNVCNNTNTNVTNNGKYNYAEKCGNHNWVDNGRCKTSSTPCCSAQNNGYCGNTCTLNREYDYIAPSAPVAQVAPVTQGAKPNCAVAQWSGCTAPTDATCTGNQTNITGIQTASYISSATCNTPFPYETRSCNAGPCYTCGKQNNYRNCTVDNDCCSKDGLCGKGPRFCNNDPNNYLNNTQGWYCSRGNSYKDNYDGDKGYKNHKDHCIPGSWRNITDV